LLELSSGRSTIHAQVTSFRRKCIDKEESVSLQEIVVKKQSSHDGAYCRQCLKSRARVLQRINTTSIWTQLHWQYHLSMCSLHDARNIDKRNRVSEPPFSSIAPDCWVNE